MPNQPKTPVRHIRIAPELWEAARRRAHEQGQTLSDVIRKHLEEYVK